VLPQGKMMLARLRQGLAELLAVPNVERYPPLNPLPWPAIVVRLDRRAVGMPGAFAKLRVGLFMRAEQIVGSRPNS